MIKEEYLKQKRYFVLYLKNGQVFDFDKECRYLKGLQEEMTYFIVSEDCQLTLMAVPRENILYIKSEVL